MTKKGKQIVQKSVAFAKVWRGGHLFFDFYGVSKSAVAGVFRKMQSLYEGCQVAAGSRRNFVNGKCYKNVIASITHPRFNLLSEDEWPNMITHLLQEITPCDVTFYPEYEQSLNDI